MPKKTVGYTDCKIYQHKNDEDSDQKVIGVDFGDLRLKTLSKLVPSGDTVTNRHKDAGYLLKKLAERVKHELPADLCPILPNQIFQDKSVRIELSVASSDAGKAKKALLGVLKKEFGLRVAITK